MTTFGLVLDGNQPKLLLQRVPEAKAAKNRMHLDIVTADIRQEAGRAVHGVRPVAVDG
jgi:hypothetical protein